jgi:hypothetical protein
MLYRRTAILEAAMKFLDDIPAFPRAVAQTLAGSFGIDTAEAFYGHAVQDPEGMRRALQVSREELDGLVRLAEGHLDPQFIARARAETVKHPRGVIVPDRPAQKE